MGGHFGATAQVSFFALPDDVAELEQHLRALEPLVVLHMRSPTAAARVVPDLHFVEAEHRWLFYALARAEDVARVRMHEVPAQGYWTIDTLRSPVVECSVGGFDGTLLRRGRLYVSPGWWDDANEWRSKGDTFHAWAKRLLAATRRHFPKRGADHHGPRAWEWVQRGGRTSAL